MLDSVGVSTPCWGPVLPLFQVLWARPQPHAGGESGALVFQPAGQQQQQWHQQEGAKAFQTLCEEESQAQEMCPAFHWLLWPQQGQVHLTSGAERVFGSQQGRRWVPFLPHCRTVKTDKQTWQIKTELQQIQNYIFSQLFQKCHSLCAQMSGIKILPCKCSLLLVLWLHLLCPITDLCAKHCTETRQQIRVLGQTYSQLILFVLLMSLETVS